MTFEPTRLRPMWVDLVIVDNRFFYFARIRLHFNREVDSRDIDN
jgi:hypothetical protein